ncbi:hypothetical protein C0992_010084 [Termitomyces sp. T32_za158]|nr:hypothetical protein C0992_010084 [Termitomyces sp. T32_za158]
MYINIQELVNYIVRNRSEEERAAFIRPFQDAFKAFEAQEPLKIDVEWKRRIFKMVLVEVKNLGDGTEKEIEGFFNLLFSHLYSLYASDGSDTKDYVNVFIQLLTDEPSTQKFLKYRILSNLFNATEHTSSIRPLVYSALVQISSANGDLDALQITRKNIEKWLSEWHIAPIEKASFLKTISGAYEAQSQPEIAYEYERLYVQTLPLTSPDVQQGAIDLITTALRLPSVFDFDPLFKLDAVISAKGHELFSLLQIFLSDGLLEFNAWIGSRSHILDNHSN